MDSDSSEGEAPSSMADFLSSFRYEPEPLKKALDMSTTLMPEAECQAFRRRISEMVAHFLGFDGEFEQILKSCKTYEDVKAFVYSREKTFMPEFVANDEVPSLARFLSENHISVLRALFRAAGIPFDVDKISENPFDQAWQLMIVEEAKSKGNIGDRFIDHAKKEKMMEEMCRLTIKSVKTLDGLAESSIYELQNLVLEHNHRVETGSRETSPRRETSDVSSETMDDVLAQLSHLYIDNPNGHDDPEDSDWDVDDGDDDEDDDDFRLFARLRAAAQATVDEESRKPAEVRIELSPEPPQVNCLLDSQMDSEMDSQVEPTPMHERKPESEAEPMIVDEPKEEAAPPKKRRHENRVVDADDMRSMYAVRSTGGAPWIPFKSMLLRTEFFDRLYPHPALRPAPQNGILKKKENSEVRSAKSVRFVDFKSSKNTMRFFTIPSQEHKLCAEGQMLSASIDDGYYIYSDDWPLYEGRQFVIENQPMLRSVVIRCGTSREQSGLDRFVERYGVREINTYNMPRKLVDGVGLAPWPRHTRKEVRNTRKDPEEKEAMHLQTAMLGLLYKYNEAELKNVVMAWGTRMLRAFQVNCERRGLKSQRTPKHCDKDCVVYHKRELPECLVAGVMIIGDAYLAAFNGAVLSDAEVFTFPIHIGKPAITALMGCLKYVLCRRDVQIRKMVFAFGYQRPEHAEDLLRMLACVYNIAQQTSKKKNMEVPQMFYGYFKGMDMDLFTRHFDRWVDDNDEPIVRLLEIADFDPPLHRNADVDEEAFSARLEASYTHFVRLMRTDVGCTVSGKFYRVVRRNNDDYAEDSYPPIK